MSAAARRALARLTSPTSLASLASLASLTVALVAGPAPAAAQAVRIAGSTSIRYVEVRPLERDSLLAGEVAGEGLLRQMADGRVLRCIPGEAFCRDVRPGAAVSALPVIQDLEVSAWGFGEGVRGFAQLRGRSVWSGSSDLWPQSGDAFDLLAAYAELERARFRLRAGRQWQVSGLGFYNFDGVAAAVRPAPAAWLEAYAGRSLMRGLNEPRTGGALAAIETLAPPEPGVLAGVQARYRPGARLALGATYQVDFRADGRGVYSELATADGSLRLGGGAVEGSVEADLAAGGINEARLRARSAPLAATVLHAEVRRYRPYFELWTIWGAFSPVGFDEARGGAAWSGDRGRLLVRGEASYRSYGDAAAADAAAAADFRTAGWGAGTTVSWAPRLGWRLEGAWRVETGFGAARREAHAGVVRRLGTAGTLAVHALAFQRAYEFRLEEGTVLGAGAEASLRLSDRARATGGFSAYHHPGARAAAVDWNQRRGHLRVQWLVGPEPGHGGAAGAAGVTGPGTAGGQR
jgi:hypothetical protein